ncbi:MAG: AsmA family protein [Opitutaceae bacterium]|nr:AsmA family protein [Opitutaceae bacterium]MBP9912468.1 AsmA family protein [Opitutaceae bacterium]
MKFVRFLLIGAAVLVGLLALAAGVASTSAFQTWVARRVLAAQPAVRITLQRVAGGLHGVKLEQVRVDYEGASLTLPAVEVAVPLVAAAWHEQVAVTRLSAKGWTLDLTKYAPLATNQSGGTVTSAPLTAVDTGSATVAAVALAFQGVFNELKLPVDLTLDGVELEGVVIFAGPPGQAPGRAEVSLRGGQVAANREGAFTFTAQVTVPGTDAPVKALALHGTIGILMDSARTFAKLAVKFEAEASGPSLPQGVRLALDLAAARITGGESYTLKVQSMGKRLVDLQANYPAQGSRLGGTWKLDVRDTDVAPFALGRTLPSFEAIGAGMFEADANFTEIHAAGRLKASADGLAIFVPELAAVGALGLSGDFDLTQRGDTTRIDRLVFNVNRPDPVFAVQSLQAFEFNPGTGELKVADPTTDLLAINLQAVPVRWLAPFVKDYTLTGGALRGELLASAGGGGLVLRSKSPLAVTGISVAQAGQSLVANLDAALTLLADYSPQGWQAEVSELKLNSAGKWLLTLAAKAGQLTANAQTIKATGSWTVALPELLQQPALKDSATLSQGLLTGEFSGTVGPTTNIEARLKFTELAVPTGEALPVITADLRAEQAADGKIIFGLPLVFENKAKARQSDMNIAGTMLASAAGYAVDAQLTSQEVFIEDVQVLAALAGAAAPAPAATTPAGREAAPFWQGVNGQVALALKKLHYNDQFEVSDVTGVVRIAAGALKLEDVRAGLGEGGVAKVNGGLNFSAPSATPYALVAAVAITDFNPAAFFRALNPGQPATVEGQFNVTSTFTGHAASVAGLAEGAQGDFQLTSKAGVFRGLPVNVAGKIENTSRIAAGVAAVGNLLGSVTGKKEYTDIANKAQAVAELAQTLSAIPYDQLSVVLARDDTLAAVLKDFTLIAPEIRLNGAGVTKAQPGVALLDSALTMEFKLSARGRTAELLKYLGALETQSDELGYTASNLPLRVSGTLGQPDTSEINRALTNLALDKTGASELLNKWLGVK